MRTLFIGMAGVFGLSCTLMAAPNFLVVLTDDQSWVGTSLRMDPNDDQSCSDYYQTPQFERLAKMGMRFTDGYAPAPFCCPTRRSLLIGQTPARNLYQKDQQTWPKHFRRQLSLPRMLKWADHAYATAHFGKWDHRYDGVTPEDMGYDVSDGVTSNSTGGGKGSGGPAQADDPKLIGALTDRACAFMERQSRDGRPFFVQVSHYAVHLDIFYSKEAMRELREQEPGEKHTMPAFAAMTADLDRSVGLLLDKVSELGIQNDTFVVFMSDNGGRTALPGAPQSHSPLNHPLRDGKGSMYEGGLRVPFVVAGPGVAAGTISSVPITGLDLLPTFADLAGFPSAKLPKQLDGGSIREVLENGGLGEVKRAKPYLVFHQAVARKAQSAIRQGPFKLVKTWECNRVELFNLESDRGESHDLSKQLPDRAKALESHLDSFLAEIGAETQKTMSKMALKQLHPSLAVDVSALTQGPKSHFFGYFGHVQTIPWNASGHYIVALRSAMMDRMPGGDDPAEVVLIDVENDNIVKVVDETHAWNPQQGTMLYWNPEAPETQFFFNDRDAKTGKVFTVLYDVEKSVRLREFRFDDRPIGNSGVAQQGGYFFGINYARMARLRPVTGYSGTNDWTEGVDHPKDDGVFRVDIKTGEQRLLVSFHQIAEQLRALNPGVVVDALFINHTLANRDNDRVFFFARAGWSRKFRNGKRVNQGFVMRSDGSGLKPLKDHIGGHPEWHHGNRMIGILDDKQVIYDVDQQRVVGVLGDSMIFPDPEGDVALSPNGQWFVNGFKDKREQLNYYVLYRPSDGMHLRSQGFNIGRWHSGDLRQDPSPCWNRKSNKVLVPAVSSDGKSRQLFIMTIRED